VTAVEEARTTDLGEERRLREDLAAAFRWSAHLDLHEGVANHFSVAVDPAGERFLINPRGMYFGRARASRLAMMDTGRLDEDPIAHDVDPTAWVLHGHLHARVPRARCVLHTHMPYATALACLDGFEFLMLDQNACRFHDRIAYDRDYAGLALDPDEGQRVASMFESGRDILFLGNHGVIVIGPSIAEAFDDLYYLERAAKLQVLALSTGRELSLVDDATAALAREQWMSYPQGSEMHFQAIREALDAAGDDYAS
jgi:ribulose-5-phosphate 4-epimerase/fuculose-1-phosphate aldolase